MLDRPLRFGWSALLLLMFVGGAFAGGTVKTAAEIYDNALESVVTLQVVTHEGETFVGSGFVAGRPGLIATAWHVVHDARTVVATFADGGEFNAFKIPAGADAKHDLALLRLERPHGRPVEFADGPARVASRIYVIGAPRGYSFSIVDGLISQVQQVDGFEQYQISCPISPGNSGAPLIDERGAVLGVVSWSKRGAQNLNFAVPITHLDSMLDVQAAGAPEVILGSFRTNADAVEPASRDGAGDRGDVEAAELARMNALFSQSAGRSAQIRITVGDRVEEFDVRLPVTGLADALLVGARVGE